MTEIEARELLSKATVAPDDLVIGTRRYTLSSTQMNRRDAQEEAEAVYDPQTLANGKIFKYTNGYAIYQRKF
jgi:hypothetical protein